MLGETTCLALGTSVGSASRKEHSQLTYGGASTTALIPSATCRGRPRSLGPRMGPDKRGAIPMRYPPPVAWWASCGRAWQNVSSLGTSDRTNWFCEIWGNVLATSCSTAWQMVRWCRSSWRVGHPRREGFRLFGTEGGFQRTGGRRWGTREGVAAVDVNIAREPLPLRWRPTWAGMAAACLSCARVCRRLR